MKKNKDGLYRACIVVGRDKEGKQIRQYVYAKNKNILEEKLYNLKLQYKQGKIVKEDLTFSEIYDMWFRTKNNLSENTVESIRRCYKNHLFPSFGYRRINDIKPYEIQNFINEKLEKNYTDIIRKSIQYFNQIYKFAISNELANKNPLEGISVPHFKSKPRKILSIDTEKNIKEIVSKDKHGLIALFFMFTGIRRGELIPLQVQDIDFTNDKIYINKAVSLVHNQAKIKETKTGYNRILPLPEQLKEPLKIACKGKKNSEYIFTMQNGKMLSETAYSERIAHLKKICGVDFTAYTFRHTFCTNLYNADIKVKDASYLMGHKTSKITMDIYTHLEEENQIESKNKLNDYFSKL